MNILWMIVFILYDNIQAIVLSRLVRGGKFREETGSNSREQKKLFILIIFCACMDWIAVGNYMLWFIVPSLGSGSLTIAKSILAIHCFLIWEIFTR